MILLSPHERVKLVDWFLPEQPGRLTGMHILKTGNGAIFVDRWPLPNVVLADTAGSYVLVGHPTALKPAELVPYIRGSVFAGDDFAPLLKAAFPNLHTAEKTVYVLKTAPPRNLPESEEFWFRPIRSEDAHYLWGLSPRSSWITRTWGGPTGLAGCGHIWGAFQDHRLVSVSCGFYLGEKFVDVAVITEPEYQGKGLSTLCTAALCGDILSSGLQPIWNAAIDNPASLRVAEKLGFEFVRRYCLYYC